MKIKKAMALLLIIVMAVLCAGCAGINTSGNKELGEHHGAALERRDVLYTCNYGPQCKHKTVSTQPGKCGCGFPLKWGHILKTEGNEAILCQCSEGCQCYGIDNRQYYCNCGVPIKRVDLTGTGIYFCNCGSACYCNTVSDAPEKCRCGVLLKKVG